MTRLALIANPNGRRNNLCATVLGTSAPNHPKKSLLCLAFVLARPQTRWACVRGAAAPEPQGAPILVATLFHPKTGFRPAFS